MTDFVIAVPERCARILDTLNDAGFEAYVVGGCVRDSLLGRIPSDWDITTSARPEEVTALFRRTVPTGIKHGTVTVLSGKESYEVTTYRIDGSYGDGRHPDSVTFTGSLREDLMRRDFTVNAMAYSPRDGLVDFFDGTGDMQKHVLRAVGDPEERFREDALRIMRAVRFSAQLDYSIEEKTLGALSGLVPTLRRISAERIRTELSKLLLSGHPEKLFLLDETGILDVIMPELALCLKTPQHNPHHCFNVGEHIIRSVCAVRADQVLRLTMLFHDLGKPACRTTDEDGIDHFHGHAQVSADLALSIMKRLKYDNASIDDVVLLVKNHDLKIEDDARSVRRAVNRVGERMFPLLLEVKRADLAAQSDYQREEKARHLDRIEELFRKVLEEKDCVSLKTLAVGGRELMAWGEKPGREMGRVLQAMLDDVLETPGHNERTYLEQAYRAGRYRPEDQPAEEDH